MIDYAKNIVINNRYLLLFSAFALLLALGAARYTTDGNPDVFGLAGFLLLVGYIYPDYRRLFYLIFAVLPFSIEYYFEGTGFGLDVPSEPLMILLCGIGILVFIKKGFAFNKFDVKNPVFIILLLHLFWIFLTSINSQHVIISFKYFVAKIWYYIPFFYLPLLFVKDNADIEKAYQILYKVLFVSICIVLVRHAFEGFSFYSSYHVVRPFYRNHVTYAAISVICLPFVWMFYKYAVVKKDRVNMLLVLLVFIVGIYFSYTRAAILSIFIAVGTYYIIRYRLMKLSLIAATIITVVGAFFLSWNNKYLDFAPDFERTITHYEFDNLIEATYKLEDISSMERVYRWIAGVEMIKDKPLLGFGPATFYSEYKAYSVSRFQTYVSDNPEHSGIHNYFLMIFVEQGVIGLLIFIALIYMLFLAGETLYHQLKKERDRVMVMASILSIVIIIAMSLINDLIETDKVGPFFFFNCAILVYFQRKISYEQEKQPFKNH
ncbi:MAG: O-antigen ligase family protein [Saprospiraceae bacterium]|nr:O-antigen ligase family protein [Saprospiraceae bacterium]